MHDIVAVTININVLKYKSKCYQLKHVNVVKLIFYGDKNKYLLILQT